MPRRETTRIPFWTPKVRHRPYVQAPGLLKLVAALSIFSIVGTVIYSLVISIGSITSTTIDPRSGLYVSVLHFLLPFGVAYTISTNSVLSRPLVLIYLLLLCGATIAGQGYLGSLPVDERLRNAAAVGVFLLIAVWLLMSPKMRAYYAMLSGDEVPKGTGEDAVQAVVNPWPGRRVRAVIEWMAGHLETIVIRRCHHRVRHDVWMSIGAF